MKITRGSTSIRRRIFIADTSKTDGSGLTGLVYNSSGLVAWYFPDDGAAAIQITLASATLGTWTSGGFVEVTNMPGWYEFGVPNAALDGGNEVAIQLRGATNMAVVNIYIELDTVDYQTAAFGALRPTTAGRTLDVTATGAAGIDWANVENPTTTLNLSGTTISTSQVVASVSGAVGSVTGSVGSISGVSFPTNFDKTEITSNGHVSAAVYSIANNSITASSIQGGAITAAKFAAGAITSTVIAADAIGAAQIAADAVTEIQGTMPDRLGYLLSILAGTISDAGTAAETYAITLNGNTFTVDYSGLDSTGNRTGATLTKT